MSRDEFFMGRALELAKRGKGAVSPNPMVGAVLVRNGKILVEGWHQRFGGYHAEKLLLSKARRKHIPLRGAVLYLTLEPCVAFFNKKTPPCAQEIAKSGIKRVVIAMEDPNPNVCGRGIVELRRLGIKVSVGCLEKKAARLNAPFVAMKVAMSLDGKIATRTGDSKWITSDASRKWVKRLRDKFDAVLVGSNTVIQDNPELSGNKREPVRIILDSALALSFHSRVLRDRNVILVATRRAPQKRIEALRKRGISLKIFPERIMLRPLLRFLKDQGIKSVLVEGGSEIFGSFIDDRFINRLYWFIAPKIIGGRNALSAVSGKGARLMKHTFNLSSFQVRQIGEDLLIEA